MKKRNTIVILAALFVLAGLAFADHVEKVAYKDHYINRMKALLHVEKAIIGIAMNSNLSRPEEKVTLRRAIAGARLQMKKSDFWLRYLEPLNQKLINGPLPVEWETEVFEKFESPYRRKGSGFALALEYIDEDSANAQELATYLTEAFNATGKYLSDSVVKLLDKPDHFYFANRLFLLNLATVYTTGFECPDTSFVLSELFEMLDAQLGAYDTFNASFPEFQLPAAFLDRFNKMHAFVKSGQNVYSRFDHFIFVRDYVNPLFALNQKAISAYHLTSSNLLDYSLNKECNSVFSKGLYDAQNKKGIYLRVKDPSAISEIMGTGRLLFYDPLLSGNNLRSCASCHKPDQFFTDTTVNTARHMNGIDFLPRNTPSLLNADYNHLLMADGKHYDLQDQARAVITNTAEMGCGEKELLKKVFTCRQYKKVLSKLVKLTPHQPELTMAHVTSALIMYYSSFSTYLSPFDKAMNQKAQLPASAIRGFNLFMGKAKCATCHFAPQFNGVKPPYTGSEFEVLGVPEDKNYSTLSDDEGRYGINPAPETSRAFRTGTLRNVARTSPYMHNGVFKTLEEVIDFYDAGGGAGKGLPILNQTLPGDSLRLTQTEKSDLIAFMHSLTEEIKFEQAPGQLPVSRHKELNKRTVAGKY